MVPSSLGGVSRLWLLVPPRDVLFLHGSLTAYCRDGEPQDAEERGLPARLPLLLPGWGWHVDNHCY